MNPSGAGWKSSCSEPGRVQHVAHVLQGQVAVADPGRHHGLGHHPDQQDALPGECTGEVEEAVEQVATEHVAGHVPRGRHPLQRCRREQLAGEQRVGQLHPERVRQVRVDLEGVSEPELPVLETGLLGEVLVEQLARGHRVRGLDRVGGGEVVVLAGVDDDAGAGVHLPAEPLVDERAHRVDVAEEDAVHAVVEHHVEPLETSQRGDLGHAQAAGVVGQPHVAPELPARLVERRTHQPEVLLGRVGAGVPLPGGALGHVVDQRLAGGPDHRDHVRSRPGCLLGLRDVLVDVAGRDDQVDPRLAGRVPDLGDHPLAFATPCVDASYAAGDLLARSRAGLLGVPTLGHAEARGTGRGLLGQRLQVLCLAAQEGVPHRESEAVLQADVGAYGVGEPVHPRGAVGIGAGETREPKRRPLDRDGGVGLGELHDRPADLAGEAARLANGGRVEVELLRTWFRDAPSSFLNHRPISSRTARAPQHRSGRARAPGLRDRGRSRSRRPWSRQRPDPRRRAQQR